MRVKLETGRVGTGFAQSPGDVIDVPDDEGQRMIDAEQAVAVTRGRPPKPKAQTAARAPAECAMRTHNDRRHT